MRPDRLAAGVCLVILAAACSKKGADEDTKTVAEVRTATLGEGAVDRTVVAYGQAEFAPGAEHSLTVPAEGVVARVAVAAGAQVTAGQPLVVLRPSPQSALDLTKAAVDARTGAEALARARRLRATGLDSDADVETARQAAETASSTLASLRARQAGLVVRAPAFGVVETLTAAAGDTITAGASVGKVGGGPVRVRLGLDPAQARSIVRGARVSLSDLMGHPLAEGTLLFLDPRPDPQTRMSQAIVEAPGGGLVAGVPLKGVIHLGAVRGLVVPKAAVDYEGDQAYLMTVDKGLAHRQDVTLGEARGDRVIAASGATAGERIIVEGGAALDDGAAVKEASVPAKGKDAEP